MNPKGLEIVDLREINILRHLTDQEVADIKAVHVYGSDRSLFYGSSALYVTKNDEVFLAGYDSLVGKSCMVRMPDGGKGILKKSVKVNELSGKSVRKIAVGAEFGAALTTSKDLYMWGRDAGHGLIQLAVECHYNGARCPKCSQNLVPTSVTTFSGFLSMCNQCGGSYKNKVSTIPHPKGWKGQPRIVLGCAATRTEPLIPILFCGSCGRDRQCSGVSVGNFCLAHCTGGSYRHLIDGSSHRIPPQTNPAPHKVIFPTRLKIQEIAVGLNFLLIHTSSELIIWGDLGGYRYNHALKNTDKVVFDKVVCGSAHIAVISDKGELYTCGAGNKGQLGYTWSATDSYVDLKNVSLNGPAVDVACGQNSTVCLLKNGTYVVYGNFIKIVSGGAFSLNLFDSSLFSVPIEAFLNHTEIVESAMKHLSQHDGKRLAILTGEPSNVFIHLHGLRVKLPNDTVGKLGTCVHDVSNHTDWTESQDKESDDNTSLHPSSNLAHLFGKLLLRDLTLKLADGDFPVHRSVLFGSSSYFSQFFTDSPSPDVLDMSSHNPSAYRGLLKYFYGVPLGQMTCQDMFDLYVLATSYKEDWITADVFSKLKSSIDTNNVLFLHDKAQAANATQLQEECLAFMDAPDFKKSLVDTLTQDRNRLADLLRFSTSNVS